MAYRGPGAKAAALTLALKVRSSEGQAILAPDKSLKAQLRYASSVEAPYVLILGESELANGTETSRDMATGEQRELPRHEAVRLITSYS